MRDMEINVGIPTIGAPRLIGEEDGSTRLENMLIGKDFHWQRPLAVRLPGSVVVCQQDRGYRGDEGFRLINRLPLETYLECVVGSEMNPAAPMEFLKAHAVISRSWAVGKVLNVHPEGAEGMVDTDGALIGWDDTAAHHGFHVCSDDHCQRYQGIQPLAPEVQAAIRETAGMVLADTCGNLIDARFSKCCGGRTEVFSTCWQERDMPGLKSFADPWCELKDNRDSVLKAVLKDYDCSSGGGYRWMVDVPKSDIERNLLSKFGRSVGRVESLEATERGRSGRIRLLRIQGGRGELLLGKELWIRRLLSDTHLYSSAFEIEDRGDSVRLHGRGWGHGVGLCQIGAANMALQGVKCEDILNFYYPGTRLIDKATN